MFRHLWTVEVELETFYVNNPKCRTPRSLKEHLAKVYDVSTTEVENAGRRVRRRLYKRQI